MTIIEEPLSFRWQAEKRKATEMIVLHHSAGSGSVQDIHAMHQAQGWTGIGYHFYVRKNGRVYRGRPEDQIGTHTAHYNARSIGICFEGNFETDVMYEDQFRAGVELLEDLLDKYGELPVYGHRDFNATACPGRNFPLERMKEEATMTQEKFNQMADTWLRSLGNLPEPEWSQASGELQAAVAARITDGTRPCAPATRVEVAAMILRAREE